MLDALDAGTLSVSDVAHQLGVSRQAVTKARRKLRPASAAPAASASTTSAPTVAIDADDAQAAAIAAARLALLRGHQILGDPAAPSPVGPQGLKSTVTALVDAVALLQRLGALDVAQADEPAPLTVRIMSADDADELRTRIEADMANMFDPDGAA
ncbi:hypothetical protein [Azospirillum canadense]|uniref:hypothetical protein n=1 Tax=Azospirillum canadense TaxID=403962 RepID=UPI002226C728|nr:hypothetical protein [Azospirillum canadense]MCW2237473.1 hypothetical protein [Azospirillum canadense]